MVRELMPRNFFWELFCQSTQQPDVLMYEFFQMITKFKHKPHTRHESRGTAWGMRSEEGWGRQLLTPFSTCGHSYKNFLTLHSPHEFREDDIFRILVNP